VSESLKAPVNIATVQAIDFLLATTAKAEVTVDLSAVNFIKPVGVVAILAAIERMAQGDVNAVVFALPSDPKVCSYLRLAGVFEAMRNLGSFGDPQPEEAIRHQVPMRQMVPCTRFSNESEIEDLACQMEERFATELRGYGSLLGTCHTAFSELATNAVNHADSGGGYVLAQHYEYSEGPLVEIAVADCGIGIRNSLRKNHKYTDKVLSDSQAIELSIEEGVSSLTDSIRGYGLYHVTDDVKKHSSRTMTMRSGLGILQLHGNGSVKKWSSEKDYPGTIVSVVIPLS
jgi:anti-sigma regulatory factor (Ser/Thr protein kinase)/anti-anti-sigma regulatory factor